MAMSVGFVVGVGGGMHVWAGIAPLASPRPGKEPACCRAIVMRYRSRGFRVGLGGFDVTLGNVRLLVFFLKRSGGRIKMREHL